MRSHAARLVIGLAITAIGMFGADSSQGTWKLNPTKSKTTLANPIKSQTDIREATSDGGVKVTRTGEYTDGTPINISFTYKYDGKQYPATGGLFDTLSVKRKDANTTTYEVKKTGGTFHLTGKTVVSKDGKTLTQSSTGTGPDGKPLTQSLVFEKQ
jgi:hypothetical protein